MRWVVAGESQESVGLGAAAAGFIGIAHPLDWTMQSDQEDPRLVKAREVARQEHAKVNSRYFNPLIF